MIVQWRHPGAYLTPPPRYAVPSRTPSPGVFSALFIPSQAQAFEPAWLGSGAATQLFIAGVLIDPGWETNPGDPDSSAGTSGASMPDPEIVRILGQPGTMTFSLFRADGYRPSVYDEVLFYRNGVRVFGGLVNQITQQVIKSTTKTEVAVKCTDFNGLLNLVIVAKLYTISLGGIISIIIADFVSTYLGPRFGVTYAFEGDPEVVLGDVLFHYVSMANAVTQLLNQAPGWFVHVDDFKVLHFFQPGIGAWVAPYNIAQSDFPPKLMAANVQIDGTLYRNKQYVLPSVNTQSFQQDSFTGDGTTTSFPTEYALNATPIVNVNGSNQRVAELSSLPAGGAYDWYWITGGQGVFQNPAHAPVAATIAILVTYPAPFQLAVSAQNDAEIALHGLVEAIYQPTDAVDAVTAANLAAAILAFYCPGQPLVFEFVTNETLQATWPKVGQQITVNYQQPAASFTGIIQEIDAIEQDLTYWTLDITIRNNKGPNEELAQLARLTQQALAAANNTNTIVFVFELFGSPNLATGVPPNVNIYPVGQTPGVIAQWSIIAPNSPTPSGADLLIDILQNGVSIFPAGIYVDLPAGQSTIEAGAYFKAANIVVNGGDSFTLNLVQVGTTPGTYAVLQLTIKY